MARVVINKCFGGFSLSMAAVRRLCELQGRECYFFSQSFNEANTYKPILDDEQEAFFTAFDIPNPNEALRESKPWERMTDEERIKSNELFERHHITSRPEDRSDPLLVQVVAELGEKANGSCAKLAIVEVPDDAKWEISEYDGSEHIAEVHRTWH